ncbi:hypothetical protein KGQ71_00850 [Patescibacteria group bacterium]|nr:hypothetical protein [Patescibacteria group bacterium]
MDPIHWRALWYRLKDGDLNRIIAWFLTTVSAVDILVTGEAGQTIGVLPVLGLVLGMWLIVRSSGLIGVSDSTRVLLQEERSSRKIHAQAVHAKPAARTLQKHTESERLLVVIMGVCVAIGSAALAFSYGWLLITYVADPAWQLFGLLLATLTSLAYSLTFNKKGLTYISILVTYLILAFSPTSLFGLICLVLFTGLIGVFSWRKREWWLFLLSEVIGYSLLAIWLPTPDTFSSLASASGVTTWDLVGLVSEVVLVIFTLGFTIPFSFLRREAKQRGLVFGVLVVNAVLFTLAIVSSSPYLNSDQALILGGFYILGSAVAAFFSWCRFGRFSYAKYFLVAVAIGAGLASLLIYSNSVIIMFWFMIAVVLSVLGFILDSYSLRIIGLFMLGSAILYYLVYIFVPLPVTDVEATISRPWLGGVFAIYLPVLAHWYRDLSTKGPERQYRFTLVQALYLASFCLILGLIFQTFTAPTDTVLFLLVSIIAAWWGSRQEVPLLQIAGVVIFLAGTVKLLLLDTVGLSGQYRIDSGLIFVLVAVIELYLLWKKPTILIPAHKSNS